MSDCGGGDCGGGNGGCGDGGGGISWSWGGGDTGGHDFVFSASSGPVWSFGKQVNRKFLKGEPTRNGICCKVCCKICSICCCCCCCCNSLCQPLWTCCTKCCEDYSCSLSENSYDAQWRRERGIQGPVINQPNLPTESPKKRVQSYLLTQQREDTSDQDEHKVPLGDEPLLEKTQVDVHLAETDPVLGPNQENLTLPPYNGTAAQQQQHLCPQMSEPPHYANLPLYNTAYPPPGNNQTSPAPPQSYPPPLGVPSYTEQPPDYQQANDRFLDGLPAGGFEALHSQGVIPSAPVLEPNDRQELVSTQTEDDLGDEGEPQSEGVGHEDGSKPGEGQAVLQSQEEQSPGASQHEKEEAVQNKVTAGTTCHEMRTLKIERPTGDAVMTKSTSKISKDPPQ